MEKFGIEMAYLSSLRSIRKMFFFYARPPNSS
jgi:hypothetical protein